MKKLILLTMFMLIAGTAHANTTDLLNEATGISSSLKLISQLLRTLVWVIVGAGSVISGLAVYIYQTGQNSIKEKIETSQKAVITEIGHADRKAQVALEKGDELDTKMDNEKDRVNREFRAVETCNQIHNNGH